GIFANETTPSFFSPGVVGRVDGTITLNGSQPSMEYVYGLLSQLSQTSEPSLFGIPSSLTTQSMSVEPPVVAASVIVNFTYNSINFVLPLQVDMWVVFDDDLKISSFDVAFRNRPAAFDYVLPKLVPWISQQINTTLTSQIDNSSLVTQFMAQDVCQVSSQYCTGNNQQYATIDACMQYQALQPPPSSFAWQLGDKNIMCRYLHRNLVPLRPQTYCPEIGPNGTNICVSRDYVNVTASPFQQTLIAWKSSLRPADISGLSSGSQEALVALSTERIYPTTVAWFPISMVVYWVILYISAKLVQSGFERYSTVYPTLSFENQRTAIICRCWIRLFAFGVLSPVVQIF
ncbi:uncharacterized protein EI90DRAFT_2931113, partial [Cantharellus anzutake]|uniref:uncharacterized protein n=1 Tax=Cantharellus anzutake TaxID=1750568 RepID=UPI001903406C